MSAGKFKSELADDFARSNQAKIEAAVDAVKRDYRYLCDHAEQITVMMPGNKEENYPGENVHRILSGMETLIDSWNWLHANYHHFQKYHAAEADAWERGEYYLGTECVNCEFSRSQQRAIDDNARLTQR
jgi:hypothetical protein